MSEKNHFVIWKGIRSGPFTKEELEKEFVEGRMGLVRTVSVGGMTISGRDFVAEVETRRREEELEEQLQQQARETEAARLALERQQEEHRLMMEEERQKSAMRSTARTTPPPIPDTNPWAPSSSASKPLSPVASQSHPFPSRPAWWDGKWPVVTASLLCLLCLMSGQILREISGIAAIVFAMVMLFRKRSLPGLILILCALLSYGLGFLLSDLIQDYLTKNYPN
jgi:hypothetical protein